MSKTKKIAILAIIAMVLTMMPASLFAVDFDGDRISGANRYATALAIANVGWDKADAVVLVAGEDKHLVDALAAAPLAGQLNAPILLTPKASLNADVKAAIKDLGAKTVYVIGAVSDAVVAEVEALGVDVEKLSGADRWATAAAINAELDNPAGTFVVGYNAVADALSVASFAAANGYQIVLAKADGSVDANALVGKVYIVGGDKWVKDIEGADRLAGADRFATNAEVAEGLEYDFGVVYVANGLSLVDALAVAPLAAMDNAFVLLCSANDVEVLDSFTAATQFIAVGGTSAVPNKILDKLAGSDSGEFTVKSVNAPNLIQLKLELSNTNYVKEDLTDVTNYELEAIAKDDKEVSRIDIAKASVKDTTLTLLLSEPIKNETTGKLTIDKVVTGKELVFDNIKFSDHDIPTIKEVKVIGKDTVKFIFSEPIVLDDPDVVVEEFDFEQDGSSFSTKEVIKVKDGLEANVVVYDNFDEGDLTVKVGNGLEDYAGFNIVPKTFKVEVVEDTEAPYVTGYKDAKRDQVTLIFNEDIELLSSDEDDFYHTNSSNTVENVNDDVKVNGNEMTLYFDGPDNKLPEGTAYIYIKAGAISDLWDNENNSIKTKVEIDVDNKKPQVSKVEWKDNKIVVTYNENMDPDTAEDVDNYTLVDPDGDKVTIKDANFVSGSTKKVELELRDSDPDSGTYELTIQKVEDKAGNTIEKVTLKVNITDSKPISYDGLAAYYEKYGSDKYRIYIEFGEELATSGNYSAVDLFKYEVSTDWDSDEQTGNFDNLGTLEKDDEIYAKVDLVDNGKTVRITTDYAFDVNPATGDLTDKNYIKIVGRIADAAGNFTSEAESDAIEITAKAAIRIWKAEAKSKTTIEVTFDNGYLTSYDPADFLIWKDENETGNVDNQHDDGEKLLSVKSVTKGSDPDKAIITLVDKKGNTLPADTTGYCLGTKTTTKSKNASGRLLQDGIGVRSNNAITITDKIAPGVAKLDNQKKSYTTPDSTESVGSSDGVNVVWAETKAGSTPGTYDSRIYVQFNEKIYSPASAAGITVKIDGKKVPITQLNVEVVDGVYGPAKGSGSASLLVIKITGYEAPVMAGDTIDIGAGVIYDTKVVSSTTVPNNAADAFALSVEYKVPTVSSFSYGSAD